ncbi:MAG: hypothetical protein ACI8RZ_005847 [Myxococcota bacterium]|jgi:uncharacterized protein YjbI with pentapeptide repeats
MSRKRPGAFRNLFGQPGPSDLLDVPGDTPPPPAHLSSTPPPTPEATPAPPQPAEPEPVAEEPPESIPEEEAPEEEAPEEAVPEAVIPEAVIPEAVIPEAVKPAISPVGAELPDFGAPPPPLSLSTPTTADLEDSDEDSDEDEEIHNVEAAPENVEPPSVELPSVEPPSVEPPSIHESETDIFIVPTQPRGISDAPTEIRPRGGLAAAELTGLLEPPTSPLLATRPPLAPPKIPPPPEPAPTPPPPRLLPRSRKKSIRPRPPGARRGILPAEKGERLLAQVRAGESIHDHAFFDAALPGASLVGADLSCGQLQRVNLSGADLRSADLSESDLRGANLSGADLRSADLRGCRLELARLEGADLRGANLSGLDFSTCGVMTGADLRGALLSDIELSAPLAGARIDHRTPALSGWSIEQLVEAHQIGILIETPEHLPRLARLEVLGVSEGMVLRFTTALSFQDRFLLRGLIAAVLGPDCACQLDDLTGGRLLVASETASDLAEVAEAMSGRFWEMEPADDVERALVSQLGRVLSSPGLRNALSSLVDRLSSIELHSRGSTMRWKPHTEPLDALKHLLLKLFIPVELRWWMAVLPDGKQIVRSLPGRDAAPEAVVEAALSILESRGRIDTALFASLIEERRRREAEIRAVAALWQVALQ